VQTCKYFVTTQLRTDGSDTCPAVPPCHPQQQGTEENSGSLDL